jgi:transcriptional regulator with XRE-family HTH domain
MFGATVREYRRRAGLSQEELAGKAGVGSKTIGNIEAGRTVPRLSTVRLLAAALGLDGDERQRFFALGVKGECAVPADPPLTVPAQLPMDVQSFTGRTDQLRQLTRLLDDEDRPATALIITAIDGTAGVGKTALAVHWAHQVADRFPDGQLYINLRGFARRHPNGPGRRDPGVPRRVGGAAGADPDQP